MCIRDRARAERRRDVAEKIAAAGTVTVIGSGSGDVGAHPLTTSFAKRIDTLHGEAGQILHIVSLSGQPALRMRSRTCDRSSPGWPKQNCWGGFCRVEPVVSREKTTIDCGMVAGGLIGDGSLMRAERLMAPGEWPGL